MKCIEYGENKEYEDREKDNMATNHEQWQWQEPGRAWKSVGLYHVTLTIPSRQPLLGKLVIPNNDASQARVEQLPLGEVLLDIQRGLPSFYPEIQILHYCLMPDHLHAVWYVREKMPQGIRSAVRGFWQEVKKIGRLSSFAPDLIRVEHHEETAGFNPAQFKERAKNLRKELGAKTYDALPPIFTEMPFIRPMTRYSQLPTTIRYIDMNPQRLATKKLMPGFFRVQHDVEIAGRKYDAVGNIEILQAEEYKPVHVRSVWVEDAERHNYDTPLRNYMNGCVLAARNGAVMVSPFISPKEKAVLEVLLREEHRVIYIADNGFGEYYKPSDGLFDAVAAGRMLILSPWQHDPDKRHVTRAECVAMNGMAEEISSVVPN